MSKSSQKFTKNLSLGAPHDYIFSWPQCHSRIWNFFTRWNLARFFNLEQLWISLLNLQENVFLALVVTLGASQPPSSPRPLSQRNLVLRLRKEMGSKEAIMVLRTSLLRR
jgi:hypothetical protein